ncbi:receptor-binding cancer antigen expressed on SiSo cells-like [Daphnia pulex]|uniref:receptor-binding cancer antigen expressed on SiSo cells-like n=1 Tax=Daphnia pulex TaxID=6669 RepID=UPI001EDEFA12|nr:receptor-binding cancer antigen expressed on SiSo cells-like [Daphnia pulex]
MPISYFVNRIKGLILIILNVFKRVMCIFNKRRRKPSGDVIMECVVTESSTDKNRDKMIPWNTWEEKPATVEDHIEQYRKSLTKLRSASEEIAHEPDFFNDMTPEIKTSNSLKLNFRPLPNQQQQQKVTFDIQENFDSLLLSPPGLGEIVDEDEDPTSTGWDADAEDINAVLKQQKMEERRKRSLRSGE